MHFDTGASTSIISHELVKKLNIYINKNKKSELTMAGSQLVQSLECVNS